MFIISSETNYYIVENIIFSDKGCYPQPRLFKLENHRLYIYGKGKWESTTNHERRLYKELKRNKISPEEAEAYIAMRELVE